LAKKSALSYSELNISFWKFEQIFIAHFLFGFLHNALAGIASFLGVWARRDYAERKQQQNQITAE
jgi:hypothetical protein